MSNKRINIPTWISEEVAKKLLDLFDNYQIDEGMAELMIRLVESPQMERVWKKYTELPPSEARWKAEDLIDSAIILEQSSRINQLTDQKKRIIEQLREALKALNKTSNALEKIPKFEVNYEPMIEASLKPLNEVKVRLTDMLNVISADYYPLTINNRFQDVVPVRKRGTKESARVYLRRTLSVVFNEHFGTPCDLLVGLVERTISNVTDLATDEEILDIVAKNRKAKLK